MALSATWITVASIITAFDITMSKDASGNVITVDPNDEALVGTLRYEFVVLTDLAQTHLTGSMPKPFTCTMKPRSKKLELMIRTMIAQQLES